MNFTLFFLKSGLIVVLVSIVFTDFKGRYVLMPQLLLLFLLSCILTALYLPLAELGKMVLFNGAFVTAIVALSGLYFRIIKGEPRFLDHFFGKGDLLFLWAISPMFRQEDFVPFLIAGLLIALAGSFILSFLRKSENGIPLAGWLSGTTIVVTLISHNMFGGLNGLDFLRL